MDGPTVRVSYTTIYKLLIYASQKPQSQSQARYTSRKEEIKRAGTMAGLAVGAC